MNRSITSPLISIIITNYNGSNYTIKCINSILSNTKYPNYEILVVDSNSNVNDYLILKEYILHIKKKYNKDITLIRLNKNYGYSGANIAGIRFSKGNFIVLLNNDTVVAENWLNYLYHSLICAEDNVFCAQSKLRLADYQELIDSVGHIIDPLLFIYPIGYMEKDCKQYDRIKYVIVLQPAACIVKKEIINKIGGLFHVEYFWGHEDTDLSLRAWIAGYKAIIVPNSVVYHKRSATLAKMPEELLVFHGRKNAIITMLKIYSKRNLMKYLLPHLAVVLAYGAYLLINKRIRATLAVIKAFKWILLNFPLIIARRHQIQSFKKFSEDLLLKHLPRNLFLKYFKYRYLTPKEPPHLRLKKIND